MFGKTFAVISLVLFSLSVQVMGHALIEPAIGVQGTGARSDVQRPSTAKPCGPVDIASALKDSTPVKATNGAFIVSVHNFNGSVSILPSCIILLFLQHFIKSGQDGSTKIKSATVDTTASGNDFKGTVTITKNGVLAPQSTGTVQISATLPDGTKCTGGPDGSSCLVSFTTEGNFGNCVLVSTGADGKNNKDAAGATPTTSAPDAQETQKGSKKPCKSAVSLL